MKVNGAEGSALPDRGASEPSQAEGHAENGSFHPRELGGSSRETAEKILGSMTDGYLVLNREWIYTYLNDSGARFLKMEAASLVGRCVWDLFPDAQHGEFWEQYHLAMDTGQPVHFDAFYPAPLDLWLECHCYPSPEELCVFFRDITGRKQVEAELRQTTERYDIALNCSNIRLFTLDPDLRFTWVSNKAFGFEPEALQGKTLGEMVGPFASAGIEDAAREVMRTGLRSRQEVELETNGQTFCFDLLIEPMCGPGEKSNALTVAAVDITASRENQKILQVAQHQNTFLAGIVQHVAQPFAIGTPEGQLTFVNPAFERLTGYTAEELCSIDWANVLTAPHWREREQVTLAELVRTGEPVRYEKEYVRKDGSLVPIELHAHLVSDAEGKPEYFYSFLTDLTERKQAEAARRRSEERILLGVEVASLALAEIDYTSGNITLGSAAAQMFGLGDQPMTTTRSRLHATFHPDDATALAAQIASCLDPQGTGSLNMDHRIVWPNGEVRWLRIRKQVTFVGEGAERRPDHGMLAAFDVTASKKVEHALIQSEKLASVGRMASTIAHEINNPLEIIGQSIYLAEGDPGITEEGRGYLALASEELERAALITRQTLAFSRDSSSARRHDPREIVRGVLKLFSSRLASRGIAVETRLRETGDIMTFSGEMRQVLSNLLSNSMDASANHGRLIIRTSSYRSRHGTKMVRLTLADTGAGIAPEVIGKIFDPFFTTKEIVGTGLGLWVTRQLMEKHGGSIQVKSRPGLGTAFVLLYPAAATQRSEGADT